MSLLVVDDSSAMRRILTTTLTRLGHTAIVEAANGREGLQRLAASPIELVVTDWIMPEMDGIEFVRAIRSTEAIKDVPVLMVTIKAGQDHIIEALRAGVNGYVIKPFTVESLQQKVDQLLAGSARRRDLPCPGAEPDVAVEPAQR
jgi:two-component system chemotaxis response regulator CheY